MESGPLGTGVQTNVVNTFTASQNLDAGLHIKGPDPYSDMARYGGYFNASPPSTTASCTNASTSITLAAALDFQDASKFAGTNLGNGIVLYQCGAATGLSTPPAPTVTPFGVTNGATTYNYKYVAEDMSGGLTAASAAGSTTIGAVTLGLNTVNLASVVWNNTLNGEQVYTCSGNCNIQVNSPIRIDGFTNNRFNGNYTVIAQTATTFTVYSPAGTPPLVTSESAAATMKVLACNILSLPASSVATIETAGDSVLRYWVYRNNVLAFVIQSHDPYYDDCGMNMDNTRIPSYVPSSPGSAVNKYLATTIVSGGGTASITVANQVGNTISGVTALHDNSQNLLAATNLSHFFTPVYANLANAPFNATTVFSSTKASNTEIWLPVGAIINQPWVVTTGGILFRGGQMNGAGSFQLENVVNLSGGGSAYPVMLVTARPTAPSTVGFKNIGFSAPALGQIAFIANGDQGSIFGLQMDNVGFGNSTSASNVNIPAAVFIGIQESAIGKPGNRNSCAVAQVSPGPPCVRFTTTSVATNSGAPQLATVGLDVQVNGFAFQGGGSSVQVDTLPWTNSGGTSPFGARDFRFVDGLREMGKGPFLRVISVPQGSFYFKFLDDDAPNASVGNGWVDAAAANSSNAFYDFEQMNSSVGGQVAVAGPGIVTFGPNAGFSNSSAGTTGTAFSSSPRASGSGSIAASGTASIGYLMGQPAAPNVVVGAHLSCGSNCVAAGTYVYAITALDVYGNSSLLSPGTRALSVAGTGPRFDGGVGIIATTRPRSSRGHGSTAGMMAYGDANAIAMEIGEFEVLPVVEECPVAPGRTALPAASAAAVLPAAGGPVTATSHPRSEGGGRRRSRDWDALTEAYRRRLTGAGITRETYEAGASLGAARGHQEGSAS